MREFSHLKNKLLAEQVEDEIYHYILDTPLEPGAKLPNEFELGEKFGVGRSTVREAVKLLSSKGIVEVAQPIVSLLFGGTNGVAGKLLMLGSFTILLNGMSNISNGVLQGIGKPKIPMMTAAVALVVDVIAVVLLLMFTDLGIYALLVAMIIYAIVVCVMNDIFMKKYLDYRNPWKTAYVSPIIASVVMGVVAAGVYYGLHAIVPSNIICLGVSIILAAAAYFLIYVMVDKSAAERLLRIPGGTYLVRIADKFHR